MVDVEIGESLGLLKALNWIAEMELYKTDIELDCKRVVDGLYSKRISTSDFSAILNDCRIFLATNLVNSHVKFIRRQTDEVSHNLAQVATSLARLHNFIDIPTCIYNIIMNEMR
jgi:hypothetical protein